MSATSQGKAKSFVRGALLLAAAAFVARLVGAFYRPLVAYMFAPFDGSGGTIGLALTQIPQATYMVVLSFTSVGLNVGISKLVAERVALGDIGGAKRIFRLSRTLMGSLGLAAAILLWVAAPYIPLFVSAEWTDAVPGYRAIAPALFFVSLMAAYRGLFQGVQELGFSAISQLIEQFVRIAAGLALIHVFVGESVVMGAAGYNAGEVIGAVAALGYLLWMGRKADLYFQSASGLPTGDTVAREPTRALIRRIFKVAGPIAVAGAVVPLMMQADSLIIFRVFETLGIPGDVAKKEYGFLVASFMIVYLPTMFTTALYTSLLPSLTEAVATGQLRTAQERTRQSYRLTMLLALPAQVGLWLLADGVYAIIYPGEPGGGIALAALSWAVTGILVQQISAGVLQGYGNFVVPLRNSLIGLAVKVVLTWFWTGWWGVSGAAYATAVGFAVAAGLNLLASQRIIGRAIDVKGMFVRPLAAAAVMGAAIWGLQLLLGEAVGLRLLTLGLIPVGAAVYGLALMLVGGISQADLMAIPRIGPRLAGLLGRYRLIR